MATDKLTGNMPTENLLQYFKNNNIKTGIDDVAFEEAMSLSGSTFPV